MYNFFRMTVEQLEPISCTDLVQKWGKPQMTARSKELFQATQLNKVCCFPQKEPRKEVQIPDGFEQRVRDVFTNGKHGCIK